MTPGYFAALAAQQLAETEALMLAHQQIAEREMERHRQEYERLRREHEALHGVVIDVDVREVPDVQALSAPEDAQPIRDQVGTTERDITA